MKKVFTLPPELVDAIAKAPRGVRPKGIKVAKSATVAKVSPVAKRKVVATKRAKQVKKK